MSNPAVSIVMPSYNAARFILSSIQSVVAQTFKDWELLVVDDASTDETVELVRREYASDTRVKVIALVKNSGAAVARNTAIAAAEGRFIAFLDCDDLWLPEKLSVQLAWMHDHDCAFSFTAYERILPSGEVLGKVGVPARTTYAKMLKTSVIGCSTAMYDTRFFGKVYMPLIRMRQDFGLWLALLRRVDHADGISQVLARYKLRPGSVSSNKRNAARYTWRVYREVEKLPMHKAMWCFANYAGRGYLRFYFPGFAKRLGFMDE